MGGFLVTTLILGAIIIAFLLTLYKAYSNKNKYQSKVRLIAYTDYNPNLEFKIQKFYGLLNKLKTDGKIQMFLNEQFNEKLKEEGFIGYKVNKGNKEVELKFEKDKYFNYIVNFGYNDDNQLKIIIKNIYETRKNEN
ncbi:hypothetical protein [Oceanirhabdus sp. W0125-5]|uniref:hypothetical protein n=1 Tax=Oceanirhabdus sp. W0125-5 TaxID=2999116 RepID=UPI0022F3410C|nr:hypothetical protein [Oceanirhabdus sp. W0125-5]WBW95337.1 hypothetical protein OW730_16770 [Oceanirhabdus sp. W0125-5]